ncbi:MAG: GTPase Era [Solirubrobacteraceae bacterium]
MTRSGFVALAGRPNVGKSTLVNAIVGAKVAIVSDKPQTTRRAIRGVATGPDWQLILVDLPGVQRPRDALTDRMQRRVEQELSECDAALLVVNGEQGPGPGDRWIARVLTGSRAPVAVAVNKVDRLGRAGVAGALHSFAGLTDDVGLGGEIFPISARRGAGVAPLVEHLVSLVPEGPLYYPREDRTDMAREVLLSELIREQVLARTFQELPHAVEVEVDEVDDEREDLARVHANVWTETDSQKGIVIGAGGRMVKAIGVAARRELERELGRQVHLELSVRVRRRWRADDALLDRLGIE